MKKLTMLIKIYTTTFKFRHYLENGIYFFHKTLLNKEKKSAIIVPVFSFRKNQKYNSIKFFFGYWSKKIVFELEDKFCYFPKCSKTEFKKMMLLIQKFNYNKMKVLDINYKQKFYFASKVDGQQGISKENFAEICKSVISFAKTAERNKDSVLGEKFSQIKNYIQHLDMGNGFWKNNKYTLIDFDTLEYAPPLYDFIDILFRICAYSQIINGEEIYLSNFLNKEICECFCIKDELLWDFKDECLKQYLIRRIKYAKSRVFGVKSSPNIYKWINKNFISHFPKTEKFLIKWQIKNDFEIIKY